MCAAHSSLSRQASRHAPHTRPSSADAHTPSCKCPAATSQQAPPLWEARREMPWDNNSTSPSLACVALKLRGGHHLAAQAVLGGLCGALVAVASLQGPAGGHTSRQGRAEQGRAELVTDRWDQWAHDSTTTGTSGSTAATALHATACLPRERLQSCRTGIAALPSNHLRLLHHLPHSAAPFYLQVPKRRHPLHCCTNLARFTLASPPPTIICRSTMKVPFRPLHSTSTSVGGPLSLAASGD